MNLWRLIIQRFKFLTMSQKISLGLFLILLITGAVIVRRQLIQASIPTPSAVITNGATMIYSDKVQKTVTSNLIQLNIQTPTTTPTPTPTPIE